MTEKKPRKPRSMKPGETMEVADAIDLIESYRAMVNDLLRDFNTRLDEARSQIDALWRALSVVESNDPQLFKPVGPHDPSGRKIRVANPGQG